MVKEKKKSAEVTQENKVTSGEFVFPNKDRYKGEYISNPDGVIQRHGHGVHTTCGGITYEGNWSNDKMNGKGRLTFPSGSIYDGEFQENHYSGQGVYTWPNGCVYKGSFEESKLRGEGQFYDTHDQVWTGYFHYKAAPGLKFRLNL